MQELINRFLKFLSDNKDALGILFGSGVLLVLLGAGFRLAKGLVQSQRARRIRVDTFPFDVIKPQSDVPRAILGGDDDDPLADRNIPYQARISGRNVRRELERILEDSHWVLILGRTGLGKTREAVHLAQSLNSEGWTILNLTRREWLDVPAHPPTQIQADRKLLFVLDDLNRKMYGSQFEQSPKAGDPLQPLTVPLQERLRRSLEWYEGCYGKTEIRVIATARNEKHPEESGEPSEWEKLEFGQYPALWKRFAAFELPAPSDEAAVGLLTATAPRANIEVAPDDYLRLAQRNDGTFANLVENLRSASSNREPLKPETFRDTLKGTWNERYRRALKRYPGASYIYDAVELLQKAGISVQSFTLRPTAALLAHGSLLERFFRLWQILTALPYLVRVERIIEPRDGQIEAKGTTVDWRPLAERLTRLVLELAGYRPHAMLRSLSGFGIVLYFENQYEPAARLWRRVTEILPQGAGAWTLLGAAYIELGRHHEAITASERAIELNSQAALPRKILGNALHRLSRYDDAIVSYQRAIELDPNDAGPHGGLGTAYISLGRHDEGIAALQRATELDPNDAVAHSNLGAAYSGLGRYEEAIDAFQPAIRLDPNVAKAHQLLGRAYRALGRHDEAIAASQRALEIDLTDIDAYYGLSLTYRDSRQLDKAVNACRRIIEIAPDDAPAHNGLGYLYIQLGELAEAESHLKKAIEISPDHALAMLNLGIVNWRRGAVEEAQKLFADALLQVPGDDGATRGWLRVVTGEKEGGLADIREALVQKHDPSDIHNLSDWTTALSLAANPPMDLEDILHAVKEMLPGVG